MKPHHNPDTKFSPCCKFFFAQLNLFYTLCFAKCLSRFELRSSERKVALNIENTVRTISVLEIASRQSEKVVFDRFSKFSIVTTLYISLTPFMNFLIHFKTSFYRLPENDWMFFLTEKLSSSAVTKLRKKKTRANRGKSCLFRQAVSFFSQFL